jgi:8-oxo-dGTP diphosphatase
VDPASKGAELVDVTQAPAYPALGVAAKGIIRRADGAVLLIRRSPTSKTDPDCWDLPGGKMDRGERLVDALAREAREETGLTVQGARPFYVAHFEKEPFWVTCVTFLCASYEGEVRLSSEHVEHAWVQPGDLAERSYSRAIREQFEAYAALVGDGTPA